MFGKIKIFGKAQLLGTTLSNVLSLILFFFLMSACVLIPVGVHLLLNSYPPFFTPSIRTVLIITSAVLSFLFIFIPTAFGFSNKFFSLENSEDSAWLCWYKPSLAVKSIRTFFAEILIKFFWFLILNVPAFIVISMTVFYAVNFGIAENIFLVLVILSSVLLLCGSFFAFVVIQRYFLFPYFILQNPEMKIKEAVKNSTLLMDDICFKTALFKLSFIPWFLSCIFVIPIFYVVPYYKTSCSFYFKECNSLSQ